MGRFKLACGTWAYMFPPYTARPYTLEECVERISGLKFDGIELSGFKPHAHPESYPTKTMRNDLLSMVKGHNMGIAGYAADLSGFPIPYDDIRSIRERKFYACLKFCADLDIKTMRVDTVSSPEGVPGMAYETCWQKTVKTFRNYAQKAKDVGVVLVWEFEPGFMFNKPSEIVSLLKEVDHPNFQAMIDTCHAHCCGIGLNQIPMLDVIDLQLSKVAAAFTRRLMGRIGHMHLVDSDNTLNPHRTSSHVPFERGVIDFDEVMKALVEIGYEGWLSLDLCYWPQAWEETEACKIFLDKLVGRYA